ncbi:MAG: malto-oligosyltrehalose trehalohydrolase [Opitutae bacterium]|nr:malto-oligosyltrehalose trehalohydrolase [Opitutae bacterium]
MPSYVRKFPIGAELMPEGGTHFRVLAPASKTAAVELLRENSQPVLAALEREPSGHFSGAVPEAAAGLRYRIRVDTGAFPDPASRFQPDGPHGPSEIVAPDFAWTDAAWRGRTNEELVVYELHLGTFTPEGTWRAAMEKLPALAELGITAVEVMPIADFPGQFGWGYDGVNHFAPCRLYGTPADAKAFVDRAHALGLAAILDVVYNHFGPDGNYLAQFSRDFVSRKYANEWGDALNFDGENAAGVREFFVTNAAYWIGEYHFDGLRLDATQQIFDESPTHVLAEVVTAARTAAPRRHVHIVAENEAQHARLVRPARSGGCGMDSIWNDDFHHSALVAATGRAEAYFRDFRGAPQEFVSALKYGFLYQGQWYEWQQKRRGEPAWDLRPAHFTVFLENHDQVSNFFSGARLHQQTSPGRMRALTALLLLAPCTPLLFQGQEFASSAPFVFFADHHSELAPAVREGRRKFLTQFRSIADADLAGHYLDPSSRATFERCKLDWGERERHVRAVTFHADLLKLRRETHALRRPERFDGAVLGAHAFVLRFFSTEGDRLLVVNLGADLHLQCAPEPLLAPPGGGGWRVEWSSEELDYGGRGVAPLETRLNWIIPAEATVLLVPHEDPVLPAARLGEAN